jgi:2-oxoisovalerate dehydrogenase E1 component
MGDVSRRIIGTTGIVGGQFNPATGVALACKLRKMDSVVACFYGDGAAEQGEAHGAMNFAGLKRLPIVYVCENNQYAEWTPVSMHTAAKNFADRAEGYGFPGTVVDGQDVLSVFEASKQAISRARQGQGPTLLECKTYRYEDHCCGFPPDARSRLEIEQWKKRDPIELFKQKLLKQGVLTENSLAEMERKIREDLDDAVRYAEESPWPDKSEITKCVYGPDKVVTEPSEKERESTARIITFGRAINEAIHHEMQSDEKVFMMGVDIGSGLVGPGNPPLGAIWPATENLYKEFPDRIISTPISEATIAGAAVGAAMAGMRAIADLMYADFLTIAMDQIVNTAAKMRYNYGGSINMPVVFRLEFGPLGEGMHHSQSSESWILNVPGLKVVMPSTPYDAKGLLIASIRDDNPILFFESKLLYTSKGPVPETDYQIPLGKGDVKRKGADVTIVATGQMVQKSLKAAEQLSRDGIDAEVVDPRTLRPLDKELILDSVKKTGKLVIVHEAPRTFGFAGEIAAIAAEEVLDYLDAPVVRVASPDAPVPFSPSLWKAYVPNEQDILAAVKKISV